MDIILLSFVYSYIFSRETNFHESMQRQIAVLAMHIVPI